MANRVTSIFDALVTMLGATALLLGYIFLKAIFTAWILMVAVGNLHQVWPAVPALGFWQIFSTAVFLSAFISVAAYQGTSKD